MGEMGGWMSQLCFNLAQAEMESQEVTSREATEDASKKVIREAKKKRKRNKHVPAGKK